MMLLPLFFVIFFLSVVDGQTPRRFHDIAEDPTSSGLNYRRVPSLSRAAYLDRLAESLTNPITLQELVQLPWGTHGQPGVAVGDFNEDGYDDIYVTNGPGAANSLFINQFPKNGKVEFKDTAAAAGVAATSQDSTGVCYGDLNGDGHIDLIVLSEFDSNKIFLSNGDSTFRELSWTAATGDSNKYPSAGCALGDVNNDGKLDLVVANGVPRKSFLACAVVPFNLNPPNQLFINVGETGSSEVKFKDTSLTSGINDYGGNVPSGKFTLTWAATLIDINLDGNLDIVASDDQCALTNTDEDPTNGVNRGYIRVQLGDGTGKFVSRTLEAVKAAENGRISGAESWMGLSFGDLNCDGKMDFFCSNMGTYHSAKIYANSGKDPPPTSLDASRWYLADNSPQGFTDASAKDVPISGFGWGTAIFDYDNDGDQDIVMVGSLDGPRFAGSSNPNVIYKNSGCKAKFTYDLKSLKPTGTLRNYQGLAIGDFNQDGYPDVVAASGYRAKPEQVARLKNFSHPLDETAFFTDILDLTPETTFVWSGNLLEKGDMMVQINSKTNEGTCWATVQPVGMHGILKNGMVNRGGLGATIIMKPDNMPAVMTPIVSGDSYGSQHSPCRNFGLGNGKKCKGTVDIVWPRGIRNRLYGVKNKEKVIFPEIPCSFTGEWERETSYAKCVAIAMAKLTLKKEVSLLFAARLTASMLKARLDHIRN